MAPKKPNSPPRKGPTIETELEHLYRRRILLKNLITTLEAYARAGPLPVAGSTRKAA